MRDEDHKEKIERNEKEGSQCHLGRMVVSISAKEEKEGAGGVRSW